MIFSQRRMTHKIYLDPKLEHNHATYSVTGIKREENYVFFKENPQLNFLKESQEQEE